MPIYEGFIECPILFKMNISGRWSNHLWAEEGDVIRVLGTFCKENNFTLKIDDSQESENIGRATMIIVEPYILVPTT